MTRISLTEQYDDRDVIAQIVRLKDGLEDISGGVIADIQIVNNDLVIQWADGSSVTLPLPDPVTGISSITGSVSGGNLTITFYFTNGTTHSFTCPLSGMASEQYVDDGLATKQDTLTFDTAPTLGSLNPVTSDGILTALNGKSYTKVVDLNQAPGTVSITGIGTDLASCKYAVLEWHDTRLATTKIATVFSNVAGGAAFGSCLSVYEMTTQTNPYSVGIWITNTAADQVDVATWVNPIGGVNYVSYDNLVVMDRIIFVF